MSDTKVIRYPFNPLMVDSDKVKESIHPSLHPWVDLTLYPKGRQTRGRVVKQYLEHPLTSMQKLLVDVGIAVESFADVIDEIKPLLVEHWAELALYSDIPLDPDYTAYEALDRAGAIVIYTVRAHGELVGYAVYFIRKHLHYRQHTWGINDIVLVRDRYRDFGIGTALFDFIEADLKKRGVNVMHTNTKVLHPELAMLLRARSHQEAEIGFSLRL
jgi:GNAT superfamily N-acetyltransferase